MTLMSPNEFARTLILKTVKETTLDGKERDSWPAPWLSGDYRHRLWRHFVMETDTDLRRLAADLFLEETEQRLVLAWRLIADHYKADVTPDVLAISLPLEVYIQRVQARYKEVFGAPPPGMQGALEKLDSTLGDTPDPADTLAALLPAPPPIQRSLLP
jgi:hypothetical protein